MHRRMGRGVLKRTLGAIDTLKVEDARRAARALITGIGAAGNARAPLMRSFGPAFLADCAGRWKRATRASLAHNLHGERRDGGCRRGCFAVLVRTTRTEWWSAASTMLSLRESCSRPGPAGHGPAHRCRTAWTGRIGGRSADVMSGGVSHVGLPVVRLDREPVSGMSWTLPSGARPDGTGLHRAAQWRLPRHALPGSHRRCATRP